MALKLEISQYISNFEIDKRINDRYAEEIEILKGAKIDGIITTNWDFLIEQFFPDYRVFVGQEQLLFSNPQAVAEIYKIHGCASEHTSLVLTNNDYEEFQRKNPYLAAKLITLFIEHPIFIIGYSVDDSHIKSILFSIASCLSGEKLEKFSENLVFVRRSNGMGDSIERAVFQDGAQTVSATVLKTDDFSNVYRAMASHQRKIPARVLRYCREQMYELVHSEEADRKIFVKNIEEIDGDDEIEFFVGIGVASEARSNQDAQDKEAVKDLAINGYTGITINDLIRDFKKDRIEFDPNLLLTKGIPQFKKTAAIFIPVYRYLREVGITCEDELVASEYEAAKAILKKFDQVAM